MKSNERQKLSNQLAKLTNPPLPLSDFLDRATELHPVMAGRLEGIWCGREGRVQLEAYGGFDDQGQRVFDELGPNHLVVIGWYDGKVEYAYVS